MVCLLFAKHCDWMLSALFTLPYLALIATFQDKYYNQSYLKLKKKNSCSKKSSNFPKNYQLLIRFDENLMQFPLMSTPTLLIIK